MSFRRGGSLFGAWWATALAALTGALCALTVLLAPAARAASAPAPHWSIVSQAEPTFFKAGDPDDAYRLIVRNDGAAATEPGSSVTIVDLLPPGVTATMINASGEGPNGSGSPRYDPVCELATLTCSYEESEMAGPVLPGTVFTITIAASVDGGIESPLINSAAVSGGGAAKASVSESTPVSANRVPFGIVGFGANVSDPSGDTVTQAGAHPFELTTYLALDIASRETPTSSNGGSESPLSSASLKDFEEDLPPGLIGDAQALPSCPQQAFQEREGLDCPFDTQVGTIKPYFYGGFGSAVVPVFNVTPPPRQLAELGFTIGGIGHVPVFFHLRSESDYGLTAQLRNLPSAGPLQGALLTLWGVPAADSHNLEREGTFGGEEDAGFCKPSVVVEYGEEKQTTCPSGVAPTPFITLPTACGEGPLRFGLRFDSWQEQIPQTVAAQAGSLNGCEYLSFYPSISFTPEVTQVGSPSGYAIDIHIPQDEEPGGLVTSDLKDAVLKLPKGLVLSPSFANGLQACSEAQFGRYSSEAASCLRASQVGTAQIKTPLLSEPLQGQLFLGTPRCAPCNPTDAAEGKLAPLLLQVQGSGLTIKLVGSISIDQSTGQLSASFDEDPQLPFEDLKLTIEGGQRAPLANPRSCGTPLSASSQLTPYSSAVPAEPASDPYEVSGCQKLNFSPSFLAGTINNRAGAFSPETVTITRADEEGELQSIALQNPPGLLGMLSGVSICSGAQVETANCPAASEIGAVTVGLGPGFSPFYSAGGVYLTGPYKGAPFGLAVAVPVLAGPFDLGEVIVRTTLSVDPSTAALSIASDPLPQSIDGVPLQIRTIHLDLDRKGFIFNPTSCQRLSIDATITGTGGETAEEQSPFQARGCARLPFKPKLSLKLAGQTSRGGDPKLITVLKMPKGSANLKRVALSLPPTELIDNAHIQDPCTRTQFAAGTTPGERCPAGSVIGYARAQTPLLAEPLQGPVYLRSSSHKLPDLVAALGGQIDIDLDARIDTDREGALRASFAAIPDAPVSKFTLSLKGGSKGLLENSANLCRASPLVRARLAGQNGSSVSQRLQLKTACRSPASEPTSTKPRR